MQRRSFVRLAVVSATLGTAMSSGCLDIDEEPDDDAGDDEEEEFEIQDHAEVVAGPDGAWRFEPSEVHVYVGGTVEWYFDSAGHNVTAHPDDDSLVSIPEGAEPFRSFEPGESSLNEPDSTFSHSFEVPGEYVYVCKPHVPQMRGTVVVHED